VERTVEIQVGALGGFELRPTRCFLWLGAERDGRERVVSVGRAPRSLMIPRRERQVEAGAVRMRALGNPLLTLALAGVHVARALRESRQGQLPPSGRGPAGRP
jgi:hypothetical protein